eukprot:CAMPEP_0202825848 /NCGR_PEP_ID=MMETSP1389-20130828/13256_1 /ASSEMBLY_ACC=CAM_ASM_000865 /TAXON_ID=302021 /ORGANISM="Rhodomonas sp., Strain CCMP768" /LENGTH=207 /DNA_ID=CAMNT_0049499097 /DNA_START=11 /DNA_END=631 /DNA_ORIENTATION=-
MSMSVLHIHVFVLFSSPAWPRVVLARLAREPLNTVCNIFGIASDCSELFRLDAAAWAVIAMIKVERLVEPHGLVEPDAGAEWQERLHLDADVSELLPDEQMRTLRDACCSTYQLSDHDVEHDGLDHDYRQADQPRRHRKAPRPDRLVSNPKLELHERGCALTEVFEAASSREDECSCADDDEEEAEEQGVRDVDRQLLDDEHQRGDA